MSEEEKPEGSKTEDDEQVEIIHVDEKCILEYDKKGNLKIGDCQGRTINPAELFFLVKVNDVKGNR